MNTRRRLWLLLVIALASACTSPPTPTATPEPTATPVPPEPVVQPTAVIPLPTQTLIPLPTAGLAPLPSTCSPQVTAATIVNVRNGPGMIYSIVGSLGEGETAQVDGKNADGTWWRILDASAPGGHGWVAGSVTTTSCMNPSLPVIDVSSLPAPYQAAVTNVVVGVDPTEVTVASCADEVPRMTATATIFASGPMQISYNFEIDGGNLKTHTLTFIQYGSMSVSEDFRPETIEGGHWVRLWIEGLNMQAWEYQARYRINCE
jgi:uncharacterized protein YraI